MKSILSLSVHLESGAKAAALHTLRDSGCRRQTRSAWSAAASAPLLLRRFFGKPQGNRSTLMAPCLALSVCPPPSAQTNTETKPAGADLIARMGGRGVNAHDPSTIVQCKDQYWVFYTGRGVQSYHS